MKKPYSSPVTELMYFKLESSLLISTTEQTKDSSAPEGYDVDSEVFDW